MRSASIPGTALPWALLLALLLAPAFPARAQTGWRMPSEAQAFDIAREITAGGMPMRLTGFVSALPPRRLAERFAQSLGEPLVEARLARGDIVLGRMEADAYLTVQIAAAGSGSRGIVALADLKRSAARPGDAQDAGRWLARLPAGTRVLSDKRSRDSGRLWRQLVLMNAHTPAANRAALVSAMQEEGLHLQHAVEAPEGQALLFAAPGREAIASIVRGAGGASAIVLDAMRFERSER